MLILPHAEPERQVGNLLCLVFLGRVKAGEDPVSAEGQLTGGKN